LQSHPCENELLKILPAALTTIVSTYANAQGPNTDTWYNVLRQLNILPKSIPPLPLNIHEILATTCPIFGAPKRLTDTHSLWLIPGGKEMPNIDTLASCCGKDIETEIVDIEKLGLKANEIALRTAESVAFEAPVWIMISDLLPRSVDQLYKWQEEMITKLRQISFANYEIPSFKYALAASMFKIKSNGTGLWQEGNENKITRVRESFSTYYNGRIAAHFTLTVGSERDQFGHTKGSVNFCLEGRCVRHIGIAALWVNFQPKPPESHCVLS
jgi:hypothetical protein